MTTEPSSMQAILETLRREFDESFARPRDGRLDRQRRMFLEVVPGPNLTTHLLPIAALAGIQRQVQVLEVPAPHPAFVGLTGWKFRPCPVYDLEPLLEPAHARSRLDWIAFHDRSGPVAFTFAKLTRVVSLEPGKLRAARADEPVGCFVREIADHDGNPVPVIDVPAIAEALLENAAVTSVTSKEDET